MRKTNDLAEFYFHQGTNFNSYDYLGCTYERVGKSYVYTFRTWAPNATSVELISEFGGWDNPIPFERVTDAGVWELVYTSATNLHKKAYKFVITSHDGRHCKGDPYARFSKGLDDGASLIYTPRKFRWSDSSWLKHRKKHIAHTDNSYLNTPINIYEMHAGSFARHDDGSLLNYRELADLTAPYVKAMGFTHVELLPIMEHPYDGSWGYQVCAFYAPSSRYGEPDDFRYFVNKMHSLGIGVILDWVPAHFPKDEWGLYRFDGSLLYEYQGDDRRESGSWGTHFFDLGREEVQSFLISNALYYLREFHVDGLRVDAVASMLYLDYDRMPGEWVPNKDGTNISLEALAFLRKLNAAVFGEFPDVLMIAEESGDYGNLTKQAHLGGVGFNLKWNMGWANDFYDYLSSDPLSRKYKHTALNFPIMYAFTENYCLPISHDEVVHGKRSLIDKMFGSYEDKFEQMRAALLLMMTYPGKKLMFMGTEFAQFREWDYSSALEWFMLDYPKHKNIRDYVRELNHFYLSNSALWSIDFDESGFKWIQADNSDQNSVVFKRISTDKSELTVAINFSGESQTLFIPQNPNTTALIAFESSIGSASISNDASAPETLSITLSKFSGVILKEINKTIEIEV